MSPLSFSPASAIVRTAARAATRVAARAARRRLRLAVLPVPLIALIALAAQSTGVFNLRNTGAAGVHVEVRVGTAEECEANDLLVRAELPAGGVWRIAGDLPVCWRELVARGTDGALVPAGGWSRRTVARGATADVVLTGPTSDDGAPE